MIQNKQSLLSSTWSYLFKPRNLHFLITAIAIVSLFPALELVKFPFKWNWLGYFGGYTVIALKAIVAAVVLYLIQSPDKVLTILRGIWVDKPKLLITMMFGGVLLMAIGLEYALYMVIGSISFIEILKLFRQNEKSFYDIVVSLLPAATYLFFGLVIVFTFVNIVVRIRYFGLYDDFLNNVDKIILGMSVLELARYASDILPEKAFHVLDFIYYGMFAQIGAALIICGISSGSRQSLQFVGTILFAYYIAICLFFLFPSIGPFYYHETSIDRPFSELPSYATQKYLLLKAKYLWEQNSVQAIPVGYYIGFPCMHIAQPLIVLWYLRKWKKMAVVLLTYDVLLIVAILLLEWHFFADILGGVAVAAVAVFVMQMDTSSSHSRKFISKVIGSLRPDRC